MTEIELLEHILRNLKAGRSAGYGLLVCGEASAAKNIYDMGLFGGYTIAPRTHMVNGFEVPAPESEEPEDVTEYYLEDPAAIDWVNTFRWAGDKKDNLWLSRGMVHLTKESAIANTKAKLGINPNTHMETTKCQP